jgi:hypothetical protein
MTSEVEGNCAVLDRVDAPVETGAEAAPIAAGMVNVNVRFHPDGTVNMIDALPRHCSGQQWFYRLCRAEGAKFEVFAGGRGRFRIEPDAFEALSAETSH